MRLPVLSAKYGNASLLSYQGMLSLGKHGEISLICPLCHQQSVDDTASSQCMSNLQACVWHESTDSKAISQHLTNDRLLQGQVIIDVQNHHLP